MTIAQEALAIIETATADPALARKDAAAIVASTVEVFSRYDLDAFVGPVISTQGVSHPEGMTGPVISVAPATRR